MAFPAEKRRYTFADCLAWDESDRAEVINGEIVMMAPAIQSAPENQRGVIPATCQLPRGEKV